METINAVIATGIFIITLGLIFSDKLNRTIAALAGAALMVAVGMLLNFYTEEHALANVDFNTLGLLLGMMVLVALLEPTGFFQYLAVRVGRLSRGEPVRLMVLLGIVTTVASMFLDNVTTVVLIAPVTILICEILGIVSHPFLMAEALLSNTGGVATLVGDPPNILIGSAAGFSFGDFLTHSLPIVFFVWITALLLLTRLYKKELSVKPANPEAVYQLQPEEVLTDRKTTWKVLIVIGGAVAAFLLEEVLHVSPAFVAVSAAAIAAVWVRPEIRETLKLVEWDVLIFFASLFVMVGGMEAAGVMQVMADVIAKAGTLPPMMLGVGLLWVVAVFSALIDNVPITIALIPVIQGLAADGINPTPLWWALAFGAGFGGNGTIIGSTANVVVTSLSERTRTPITPALWNKRGLPIMLATCAVATILYVIAYPYLAGS